MGVRNDSFQQHTANDSVRTAASPSIDKQRKVGSSCNETFPSLNKTKFAPALAFKRHQAGPGHMVRTAASTTQSGNDR